MTLFAVPTCLLAEDKNTREYLCYYKDAKYSLGSKVCMNRKHTETWATNVCAYLPSDFTVKHDKESNEPKVAQWYDKPEATGGVQNNAERNECTPNNK